MKITFLGAGSSVFVKQVVGDFMLTPGLEGSEVALYDIDAERLADSVRILENVQATLGTSITIRPYDDRRASLRDARYVINAIQVGGYRPGTVTDFEIPRRYGILQTIGDSYGIGGIFRLLRTAHVVRGFAQDMLDVCPDALFINFSNPLSGVTLSAIQQGIRAIGLCHGVQDAIPELFTLVNMDENRVEFQAAGINHMSWLLSISRDGQDLYPEIKQRAFSLPPNKESVRIELMRQFGYFVTESAHHNAEYYPFFIRNDHPDIVERYQIPIDLYLERCERHEAEWLQIREQLLGGKQSLDHRRTDHYVSHLVEALEGGPETDLYGSVANEGWIENLDPKGCVEVPCHIDQRGIYPQRMGRLPVQLAALNQPHIASYLLILEAIAAQRRELVYEAAILDPHVHRELTMDQTVDLCDELIEAHGDLMPPLS